MLCEECGKRPATVHISKVINGVKSERHLCHECAQAQGQLSFMVEPTVTFHNLLAGLFEPGKGLKTAQAVKAPSRCPNCGLTFADFRRLGHLGCDGCYDTFHAELEHLVKRIHGSTVHTGKVPVGRRNSAVYKQRELEKMRAALQQAVAKEEYEKAAELRDAIRRLERELGV